MSEQQVLAAVRANTSAMNTQVIDDYVDTFTEDVVWEGDALPAPVIGRAAVTQTMGAFWTAFPDIRFEVEREFASGDLAAVCWRVTGTHQGDFGDIPPTGRPLEYHGCAILQIREGKITHVWTYFDTGHILRQLGVLAGDDQTREP